MHRWIASTALALTALLSACGGGGGSDGTADTPLPVGGLVDATVYSSLPNAQLAGAEEAVAVTSHQLALGGRTLAYTATAGHLIARDPVAALHDLPEGLTTDIPTPAWAYLPPDIKTGVERQAMLTMLDGVAFAAPTR